jgi:hypothetical protein
MTKERMTYERMSGIALITGSVATIITMALHPTGQQVLAPGGSHSTIQLGVAVHALALMSLPVLFMGAAGLSKRLAASGKLSFAAMTFYGFALVAVMNAAAMSGLVASDIARRIVDNGGAGTDLWLALFRYTGELNQAFALMFVVASAIAIVLWSAAVRTSGFPARGTAMYGYVAGPVMIVAVVSGHVRLDVHGFGAIMLAQAVWMILIGARLMQPSGVAQRE